MKGTAIVAQATERLCGFLLGASFAVIQALIGGTRLLFSLPAYALLGIMGLLTIFLLRRQKPGPNQICLISSTLFFGYILVRAFVSPVPYLARPDIYSVLGCLAVYFFVACIFTDAGQRIWLILFLLAVAMVHVGIGGIQFRNGDNFMLIPFLQRFDYGARASGFYVCPNHLAGLLEVLGILGLSIACWSRWPTLAKLLTLYATGLCYLGIALTGSRGGYLSAVTSLLVFFALSLLVLWQTSTRFFLKVGGAGLVIAAVVAIAASSLIHQSFLLSYRSQYVETSNVRVDLWKAALQQWKLNPLTGTGSGTYLFYGRQFRADRIDYDPVEAHNDYLHLLAEYGIVGAFGFLIFFGTHLYCGWKNFLRLGPKRLAVSTRLFSNSLALQMGALAAIAAYLVHSALDFNLHIPANALLLALVFGLLANAGARREAEPALPAMSLLWWRLALPVIGAGILIQSARLLPGEYFAEQSRTSLRDQQRAASVYYALRGLASEKTNPNLFYYLGCGLVAEGNSTGDLDRRFSLFQGAILAFESARTLVPQDRTYPIALGSIYDALERFPEAEWMYDEALRLDPKDPDLQRNYQTHLDRWRKAGTDFERAANAVAPST